LLHQDQGGFGLAQGDHRAVEAEGQRHAAEPAFGQQFHLVALGKADLAQLGDQLGIAFAKASDARGFPAAQGVHADRGACGGHIAPDLRIILNTKVPGDGKGIRGGRDGVSPWESCAWRETPTCPPPFRGRDP